MRLKLLFAVLLLSAMIKAQTPAELRNFINKNDVALRSVQKNMLRGNNSNFIPAFREILKKQQSAVKLHSKNKTASLSYAVSVRNECLAFLKTNTKGSTEYFEVTDAEKKFVKSDKDLPVLSAAEIRLIENLDLANPQSLNALTLTIQ